MNQKRLLSAILVLSLVLTTALPIFAQPTLSVRVRVEGFYQTHADTEIEMVDGSSAMDALVAALDRENKTYKIQSGAWGDFLEEVESDVGGTLGIYWLYAVIRGGTLDPGAENVGADSFAIADGDEVLFYFADWGTPITNLVFEPGSSDSEILLKAEDIKTSLGVEAVSVSLGSDVFVTDELGYVSLDVSADGEHIVSAQKVDQDGAPLIVRPRTRSLWAEQGTLAPVALDTPSIDSIEYLQPSEELKVSGSVSQQDVEVVVRLQEGWMQLATKHAPVIDNAYAVVFPDIVGGHYSVRVHAEKADGSRSLPIERSLSVLPNLSLSDSLLDARLSLAKAHLRSLQQDSGDLGGWAAIELAGAGEDILGVAYQTGGKSHADALLAKLADPSTILSATTDRARTLLECLACGIDPTDAEGLDLVADLVALQDTDGRFGTASESGYVNSHAWAVIALQRAGDRVPDKSSAHNWLVGSQNADGGWGFMIGLASDPDMTAQAIRALLALGQSADSLPIQKAFGFLRSKQSPDGGFFNDSWDPSDTEPNVYSTLEVVRALCEAGENPLAAQWLKAEKDMLSYILGSQSSSGEVKNAKATADFVGAIHAFRSRFSVLGGADPGSPDDPGDPSSPGPSKISVTLSVRGEDRVLTRGPVSVELESTNASPLSALRSSGATVTMGAGGYVKAIDGLSERGASGWKFAVNGRVPSDSASDYALRDGDQVVWFWAADYKDTGGFSDSIADDDSKVSPVTLLPPVLTEEQQKQREEAAVHAEETLAQLLEGQKTDEVWIESSPGCVVAYHHTDTGEQIGMAEEEASYWRELLAKNVVNTRGTATPEADTKIRDEAGEFALELLPGSVGTPTEVVLEKVDADDIPGLFLPSTHRVYGSVYRLSQTVLHRAAKLSIRVLPDSNTDPSSLVLARYDSALRRWIPIASVYDPASGLLMAETDALGDFAVLSRVREVVTFDDVRDSHDWARSAIETLATLGHAQGDDSGAYEPDRPISLAEFVKLLVTVAGIEPETSDAPTFSDESEDRWYAPYLQAGITAGIVQGDESALFKPDAPVSREEMAVFIERLVRRTDLTDLNSGTDTHAPSELAFSDSDEISGWAYDAVVLSHALGLLRGNPEGGFMPQSHTTRAEAAVAVARLHARLSGGR